MPGARAGFTVAGDCSLCTYTYWAAEAEIQMAASLDGFNSVFQALRVMRRRWTIGRENRPQEARMAVGAGFLLLTDYAASADRSLLNSVLNSVTFFPSVQRKSRITAIPTNTSNMTIARDLPDSHEATLAAERLRSDLTLKQACDLPRDLVGVEWCLNRPPVV